MDNLKYSRIFISGASGFVGKPLKQTLEQMGTIVNNITRTPHKSSDVFWNPDEMRINPSDLENADIIYHLAGEGLANKRWSQCRKHYLLLNRGNCVRTLRKAILDCRKKPKLVIIASAVGFYGDTEEECDEASPSGHNFSAQVCRTIECEAERIADMGIPVIIARLGVVISVKGGALKRMITPFSLCLGGNIGTGNQPFPWVSLSDTVRALVFLSDQSHFKSNSKNPNVCIFNICTPQNDTNACLTKAISQALNRPAFINMPQPLVKLLFGEMGDELLLKGANVYPKHLTQCGFIFNNTSLKDTIAYTLQKESL